MVSENATEIAILGGGCFWCTEAVFKMMKGVSSVLPGYIGGTVPNPSYEQVSSGTTGHAEAVQVTYNPQLTTYNNLLTVFFGSHDPTTRPSADIDETSVVSEFLPRMEMPAKDTMPQASGNVGMGTAQYRSAIFYTTPEQKKQAEAFIKYINDSNEFGAPVVTEVVPATEFFVAEDYHRDYFATHPGNPYCEVVINPKLEKVQKEFAHLLKHNVGKN